MATPKSQRIGIWIITAFMIIGALGTSLVMVIGNQNSTKDQAALQKAYNDYQTEVKAVSDKQKSELSNKYYPEFSKYSSVPTVFLTEGVKTVVKNDLKVGDGEEIKEGTNYSAYYIGWNPKGVIFDQSIEGGSLKLPIAGTGLIEGWQEGVLGMKLGGVREITIPSDKAYGSAGQGDNIPPNTPLKFIVMAIPKIDDPTSNIKMPNILVEYYKSQGQI